MFGLRCRVNFAQQSRAQLYPADMCPFGRICSLMQSAPLGAKFEESQRSVAFVLAWGSSPGALQQSEQWRRWEDAEGLRRQVFLQTPMPVRYLSPLSCKAPGLEPEAHKQSHRPLMCVFDSPPANKNACIVLLLCATLQGWCPQAERQSHMLRCALALHFAARLHGWTPKAYKQSPEPLMPYHINEQRKGRKRKGHRKEKERQDKTIPEEHIKKQEQTTHHRNKNSE